MFQRSLVPLLLLAATLAAQEDAPEPRGLEGFGIDPAAVNAAIEKGGDFLWTEILIADLGFEPTGLGALPRHSIAALAMIESGAHLRDPDCERALREYFTARRVRDRTYELAMLCMALAAFDDVRFDPFLTRLARCLVESQCPDGSWTYGTDLRWLEPGFQEPPLAFGQRWTRLSEGPESTGDHSATQFVVLALRAAQARGVPIPHSTWEAVAALYGGRQNEDGGWNYKGAGRPSYGSMTAAGISCLLVSRWGRGLQGVEPGVAPGLEWLVERFTIDENPGLPFQWHYYYLYGLERVGRLMDSEFIGPHEWYPLGVQWLLAEQQDNGSWSGRGEEKDPVIATAFALLFLTRATETLEVENGSVTTVLALGFDVFDSEGRKVASGRVGEPLRLAPGSYELRIQHGSQEFVRPLEIEPDGELELEFDPNR